MIFPNNSLAVKFIKDGISKSVIEFNAFDALLGVEATKPPDVKVGFHTLIVI